MKTSHKSMIAAGSATFLLLTTVGSVAFAQSGSKMAEDASIALDPAACSAALDTAQTVMEPATDAMQAAQRDLQRTRVDALQAALALTDGDARTDAIKIAQEDFRTAHQEIMEEFRTTTEEAAESLRESCKGLGHGMMGGEMGMGKGHGKGHMMGKAMDSTKFAEMLAEQGVTLPTTWETMTPEEQKAFLEENDIKPRMMIKEGMQAGDTGMKMRGMGMRHKMSNMMNAGEADSSQNNTNE